MLLTKYKLYVEQFIITGRKWYILRAAVVHELSKPLLFRHVPTRNIDTLISPVHLHQLTLKKLLKIPHCLSLKNKPGRQVF